MSGKALAAGVGENDRRLAPCRSRDTIFNRNGGEPVFMNIKLMDERLGKRWLIWVRSQRKVASPLSFDVRHPNLRLRVLKLRLWEFQPQRGGAMSAQGNALGWRLTVIFKP